MSPSPGTDRTAFRIPAALKAAAKARAAERGETLTDVILRALRATSGMIPADEVHPEDYCHRCAGPNFPWWVPSPVWNAVVGYGPQAFDVIVCPRCFAELAEAQGAKGPWRVAPRLWPNGVSLVHVDGRLWDAATELWVGEET